MGRPLRQASHYSLYVCQLFEFRRAAGLSEHSGLVFAWIPLEPTWSPPVRPVSTEAW